MKRLWTAHATQHPTPKLIGTGGFSLLLRLLDPFQDPGFGDRRLAPRLGAGR